MAGWMLLALWMSADLTAVQPAPFAHVRSEEPRIRKLMDDGYERSDTFKRLADAVEGLPCVVYIVSSLTLPRGLNGALLHVSAGRPEMPVLRVAIRKNLSPEETISVLAHELQHVVEVMSGAPASGSAWMTHVFDRLDPAGRSSGVRTYETEQAVAVTSQVRAELKRARR